jgi:hypothetical protein
MRQDIGNLRKTPGSIVEEFILRILPERRRGEEKVVDWSWWGMGLLVKERLIRESEQRGRRREEETPATRSRRERISEHRWQNMLTYADTAGSQRRDSCRPVEAGAG